MPTKQHLKDVPFDGTGKPKPSRQKSKDRVKKTSALTAVKSEHLRDELEAMLHERLEHAPDIEQHKSHRADVSHLPKEIPGLMKEVTEEYKEVADMVPAKQLALDANDALLDVYVAVSNSRDEDEIDESVPETLTQPLPAHSESNKAPDGDAAEQEPNDPLSGLEGVNHQIEKIDKRIMKYAKKDENEKLFKALKRKHKLCVEAEGIVLDMYEVQRSRIEGSSLLNMSLDELVGAINDETEAWQLKETTSSRQTLSKCDVAVHTLKLTLCQTLRRECRAIMKLDSRVRHFEEIHEQLEELSALQTQRHFALLSLLEMKDAKTLEHKVEIATSAKDSFEKILPQVQRRAGGFVDVGKSLLLQLEDKITEWEMELADTTEIEDEELSSNFDISG